MQERKNRQRQDAGDDDAADGCGPDTNPVHGSDTGREGDGEHAEAGCDDDHQHGAEGLTDGLAHCERPFGSGAEQLVHFIDDQHGGIHDDADQHHDTEQDENRDIHTGCLQCPEDADQAHREGEQNEEGAGERFQNGRERQVGQEGGEQDRFHEIGDGFIEHFGRAEIFQLDIVVDQVVFFCEPVDFV